MYSLNRNEYSTNETYLFHIYNDLGFIDLEVAYNYIRKDGSIGFSKWIRFDYLMSIAAEDTVKGTFDTKKKFLDKITHRSVLDIEVLYDFDECEEGTSDPLRIKEYAKQAISKLNKAGIYGEAYFSGSKSIHYSVLVPPLRKCTKYQREVFKQNALRPLCVTDTYSGRTDVMFSADLQKKSRRTMIALEGALHWKTGRRKERIDLNE